MHWLKLRKQVRELLAQQAKDEYPVLRIKKYDGTVKQGKFVQMGMVEGAGYTVFIRDRKMFMFPAIEIESVDHLSRKNKG
jgi:hypothetical protein